MRYSTQRHGPTSGFAATALSVAVIAGFMSGMITRFEMTRLSTAQEKSIVYVQTPAPTKSVKPKILIRTIKSDPEIVYRTRVVYRDRVKTSHVRPTMDSQPTPSVAVKPPVRTEKADPLPSPSA